MAAWWVAHRVHIGQLQKFQPRLFPVWFNVRCTDCVESPPCHRWRETGMGMGGRGLKLSPTSDVRGEDLRGAAILPSVLQFLPHHQNSHQTTNGFVLPHRPSPSSRI